MTFLTRHFKAEELLSPDGLNQLMKGHLVLDINATEKLDLLRDEVKVPIYINHGKLVRRGFRSHAENEQIGGAGFSEHCLGRAFDCTPMGFGLLDFAIKAIWLGFGGVGYYPQSNFVHVDNRFCLNNQVTFWYQSSKGIKSFSIDKSVKLNYDLKEFLTTKMNNG